MTKDELLEDVQVGENVKIYTESDEIFRGKVIDLGESGLKISILNTNKAKRIMYGRITEYDIEDSDEYKITGASEVETVDSNNSVTNACISTGKADESKITIELSKPIEEKKTFVIDRNVIFGEVDSAIDLESIRREWIAKLDSEQKTKYNRIVNILDYAKKMREYNLDSDRVKRAIAECKKIASEIKIMNVFIALIYHEFNDVRTATEFYHEGGAFDVEFQLALKYGYDDDLFEKAILAVEHNRENEAIIKWLCEYAVKNNDHAVISHIINHCNDNAGKALLFWYVDKPEIQMIPDKDDIFVNENTLYLKNLNAITSDENDTHIKSILSNVKSVSVNKDNDRPVEKDVVYKGIISFYNKNGGNGMIKSLDGGSIYFYIKQVKDIDLQRILATEVNYKRKVTYTKGINFKGEIAADAIELDEVEDSVVIEPEYEYEGFFDDYDVYENRGRIRSGNKVFNFVFAAIKDPILYAEIMSRPYSVLDLTIKFNARDHKSKKTKKSSKIAYDICGVKEYSQQEIEDFISQKYITRFEVDEWLGTTPKKDVGYFRAADYEPLRALDSVVQEVVVPKRIVVQPASNTNKSAESRSGEKKAVSLFLNSNIINPFLDLKRDVSGKKYFQDAHRYMVGRKNSNGETIGVDLDRAEELFIHAIRAMEQINSSVANLVNIYSVVSESP